MKKIFEVWEDGLNCLLFDDLISYYAFFTIILAECSYLFTFHELSTAICLSAVLIGYIFVILFTAFFKSRFESNVAQKAVSIIYLIGGIAICTVGCFVNWQLCLPLTIVPIISTFTCIVLRDIQDSYYIKPPKLSRIIRTSLLLITVGVPFVLFTVFFSLIPVVPLALKIIVPIVYLIVSPFIAYIEDDWATCNIFELFTDH